MKFCWLRISHGQYRCESTHTHSNSAAEASLFREETQERNYIKQAQLHRPLPSNLPPKVIFSEGNFTSPLFNTFRSPRSNEPPFHYFPDMECWFNFTAPLGYQVYVEFLLIKIAGDPSKCVSSGDIMSIPTKYMGNRLICGSPQDKGATITGLQQVSIRFKSNSRMEALGFSGYFYSYPVRHIGYNRRKRETTNELKWQSQQPISNSFVHEMMGRNHHEHQ